MSVFPSPDASPPTASPAYNLARNFWYELGSLKMLALVTVLTGCTVVSVQDVATMNRRAVDVANTVHALAFIFVYPLEEVGFMVNVLEPEAHAARPSARAWIDVVVDAVEPRRRVDTAV